jgi:hypothetical protein
MAHKSPRTSMAGTRKGTTKCSLQELKSTRMRIQLDVSVHHSPAPGREEILASAEQLPVRAVSTDSEETRAQASNAGRGAHGVGNRKSHDQGSKRVRGTGR